MRGRRGRVGRRRARRCPRELKDYATRVRDVTPQQLQAAAASPFSPDEINLLVVGDAMTFGAALQADHPELELIPLDQLDLDDVSLR
jgi:zinc protease